MVDSIGLLGPLQYLGLFLLVPGDMEVCYILFFKIVNTSIEYKYKRDSQILNATFKVGLTSYLVGVLLYH